MTQGDLPRGRDVACAAVLVAAEALAGQQQPAWVTGVGWATERYDLAERDLTRSEQLRPRPRRTVGAALHGFAGQVVSTSWWERR